MPNMIYSYLINQQKSSTRDENMHTMEILIVQLRRRNYVTIDHVLPHNIGKIGKICFHTKLEKYPPEITTFTTDLLDYYQNYRFMYWTVSSQEILKFTGQLNHTYIGLLSQQINYTITFIADCLEYYSIS